MVELVPVRIDRHLAADEASSIQGLNKPHTQAFKAYILGNSGLRSQPLTLV